MFYRPTPHRWKGYRILRHSSDEWEVIGDLSGDKRKVAVWKVRCGNRVFDRLGCARTSIERHIRLTKEEGELNGLNERRRRHS
jgi:hypothetical protein